MTPSAYHPLDGEPEFLTGRALIAMPGIGRRVDPEPLQQVR